ncbi:MAG TPA: hypothetical protein VEU62_07820 [Bryobacterales bacterium]|nr:hypothetical protein [Bryobacterales bacterium]
MARCSLLSNPLVVGSGLVLLLAGRWIWVAGLGDYGWTYEFARRLALGQVFYRDFLSLYGPLSHYTLAGLMVLLGKHLFLFNVHLWLSWALELGVGLAVLAGLGARRSTQTTGVSLAAVMSCPIFTPGHAFNYQAPFLAGITILCIFKARRGRGKLWAALAGAATALCVYDKQNVGLIMALLTPFFFELPEAAVYAASGLAAFGAIFAYFAGQAGAWEVARELFFDGAAAKGGLLILLGRAVPRIIFHPDLHGRRWWEMAATIAAYAALFPLALGAARRVTRNAENDAEEGRSGLGIAALVAASAAIALSYAPTAAIAAPRWPLHPWTLLLECTYIFLLFLCGICLWRGGLRPEWRAALVLIPAIVFAQEASNPNFPYSAPLAIPLLCALLFPRGVTLRPSVAGLTIAAVHLLGLSTLGAAAFSSASGYQRTEALPAASPFSGLRASAFYAQKVHVFWDEVRPRIDNHSTLWLTANGEPYLAYGGRPVYNAPCYTYDSVPLRLEGHLIETWRKDPPEMVVLDEDFHPVAGARLLNAEYITKHVLSGYVEVWRSTIVPQVGVWRRQLPREAWISRPSSEATTSAVLEVKQTSRRDPMSRRLCGLDDKRFPEVRHPPGATPFKIVEARLVQ